MPEHSAKQFTKGGTGIMVLLLFALVLLGIFFLINHFKIEHQFEQPTLNQTPTPSPQN